MTKKYIPKPVPNTEDIKVLLTFLREEFQILSDVVTNNQDVNFDVTNVEPEKRVEGMIRYFDGLNFNPGAGRGLYIFSRISAGASNVWMKL